MNENIEDDIREIVEETTKWHKLFESFWNVFFIEFYHYGFSEIFVFLEPLLTGHINQICG